MTNPKSDVSQFAAFPPVLRDLIEAELAAGNEVVEIASCFPAPPAGAYARLARPVSTRRRAKTKSLDFYDRNSSIYSGEWTDAKRFYFVIEPPRPPPPEPDMNAIREARNAAAASPAPAVGSHRQRVAHAASPSVELGQTSPSPTAAPTPLVKQFEESMVIDYEKWHDGIGYDVELLPRATPAELNLIEGLLLARGIHGWREVEALARLKTEPAKKALKLAMGRGKAEIRAAVIQHAPELVCEDDKTSFLIEALKTAQFYAGLSQALDQVATFHPPEVIAELFRGALEREGEVAIHFAAMLMFIHGKAKEPFDWEQRPFFLRFDTTAFAERKAVFHELCAKLGVSADPFLAAR